MSEKIFFDFKEEVLKSNDYNFNNEKGLEGLKLIEILERFNKEEGALPGKLEKQYLDLILDKDKIKQKMDEGEDFYEIIKSINKDLRQKNIVIEKTLFSEKVDELKRELFYE
jgi:hypothetical protein